MKTKKVVVKKQAKVEQQTIIKEGFIKAGELEVGREAVNWSRHDVVRRTGKTRRNDAGKYNEVEMSSLHDGGEVCGEWWVPDYYPVLVGADAELLRIKEAHARMSLIINGRAVGQKASKAVQTEEVEVTDPKTGEVTIEVRTKVKAPSKPRVGLDPATACTPGSSAHSVGLILLGYKPAKFERAVAIAKIMKDLSMDKGLASSWVSTLIKRKAPFAIYGGVK